MTVDQHYGWVETDPVYFEGKTAEEGLEIDTADEPQRLVVPLRPGAGVISYSIDDTDVAVIDQDGMVTPLSAGTAQIRIDVDDCEGKYKEGYLTETLTVTNTAASTCENGQHSYNITVNEQPTCTDEGTRTLVCSVCGDTKTESIPALGHNYVETVVAPTYETGGYTLHECSRCGDSYKDNYTKPLGQGVEPYGNSTISVDKPNPTVSVGETLTLEVYTDKGEDILFDCNNSNVDCEWGDWFGEDDCDSYFYITGLRAGTSVVTIYDDVDNNVKATINVTVGSQGNSTISVDNPNPTVSVGETLTLEVYTDKGEDILFDCNNSNVDCEWGDWFGEDDCDSYFYITGLRAGTSVVTIYDDVDNNVKATINVTVEDNSTETGSISLAKSRTILCVGTSLDLKVSSNTTGISSSSLKWKSSNESVAKVSSGGTVTGVKTGTATITVSTPGGISASCVVNVNDYTYLATFDWRTIRRTYSHATPYKMGVYAITNASGEDIVVTYAYYKIITNWSAYKMHNLSTGYVTDNIDGYYRNIINRYGGAVALRAYDNWIDAKRCMVAITGGNGKYYEPAPDQLEYLDLPTVKITKPSVGKKKITVKWKKVSKANQKKIKGIQIQVATDPQFKNIVKTATAGKTKTSKTIKGLKKKTKYYVRIRAYAAGYHYSVWKSKSAKVK